MKRSGFKKLTYAEIIAKQDVARARMIKKSQLLKQATTDKPKKKPKKNRVKTLKRKLWAIFSQYIRKSYADENGMVMTCDGQFVRWQDTHCGHLYNNSERNQSLGGNELWYYELNFAPQSAQGNVFNDKDSAKAYMLWAVKRYGVDEVEKMHTMKFTPKKYTEDELIAKHDYYKTKFDEL